MCERIYFPEAERLGTLVTVLQQGDTDAVTAYRFNKCDAYMTLKDIEVADIGVTIVISENALEGKVYKYCNHGPFWEKIGKTCGYT